MNHQSKHHDVSNKFENEYSSKLVRGLPETIQSPTILILLKSFLFCLFFFIFIIFPKIQIYYASCLYLLCFENVKHTV